MLGVAVVLAARTIVYALAPWQTLAVLQLEHEAGGPHLAAVLAVSVAAAALLAVAVLWLAAVAVRERLALEPRALVAPPRLSPWRLAARSAAFFAATSITFAYFESYLHWRAGLGWHGIHCLLGPVHRDAIPVLGALSLIVVAGHGAVEHLLAWTRRLVALLAARVPLVRNAAPSVGFVFPLRTGRAWSSAAPRGPPASALS